MTEPSQAAEATPTTEEHETGTAEGSEPTGDNAESSNQESGQEGGESSDDAGEPEGAPESYEFAFPEGIEAELDSSIHAAYADAARELNLPQDKAQALFEKTMSAMHTRSLEANQEVLKAWGDELRADKEIGGDNLEKNLGVYANKAKDTFGNENLRELLDAPDGIGKHPDVIRFLVSIGKAISEDSFVGSSTGKTVQVPTESKSIQERMYGQ